MYHGKYTKRKISMKRKLFLLASLVMLMTASVFGTMAFLNVNTQGIQNVFTTSGVPNQVTETLEGNTKKDVRIQNAGDTDAYVRAKIIVTWGTSKSDDTGDVWGVLPAAGKDYTISFPENTGWEIGSDGYYYYTAGPIAPTEATGILFTDCKVIDAAVIPEGYQLSVEIMGQTVQAKGITDTQGVPVVGTIWPVTVNNDGSLSLN